MASQNTSPCFINTDCSEIHDVLIVPPQPVPQKEYREEVPDISAVSDIVDNGSSLLPKPNNFLNTNTNHISYQQEQGNKFLVSKAGKDITEKTNAILDCHAGLPFMTYLNPGCRSCIINHAVITNKEYNGQYILPKPSASSSSNELSDKEMRFQYEDGEVSLNKTCRKHTELNVTASSHHKSVAYNHAQLLSSLNLKEPQAFSIKNVPNHYCCKDHHSKLRKSLPECERPVSLDSRLGKLRKSEETFENKTEDRDILKGMDIMCPACFRKPGARKPCACNFLAKDYNSNHHNSSDALSNIWERFKQQDEKIDLIHEKISNFLSPHASCLIEEPAKRNEISDATESDIPYILNILQVHSDKIKELQDEINLLKSNRNKSLPANNKTAESILNQVETTNCVNTEIHKEGVLCPYSHNAVCHEQKQKITKTSTSTMTSFVFENNDIVYHKQMTAVTGKKEASCLPTEHSHTMMNHLKGENGNLNSQKRKSHKLDCSPNLQCKQNASSNSSSDIPDPKDNQVFKTSLKGEKKSKRASRKNKVIDKKIGDDQAMKANDVKEKSISPALKTDALKSHSRSSKQKLRNSTSPKILDMAIVKDFGNKKMIRQISASSSTDTECKRTKQNQKVFDKIELDSEETEADSEDSTTVSKYGLSSKNLSKATKRYLDTYGLRRIRRLSNQYDT